MYTLEFRTFGTVWFPTTEFKPLKYLCNAAMLVRTLKMFRPQMEYRIAPDYELVEAERMNAADQYPRNKFKFHFGEAA